MRTRHQRVILDIDSSESPVYGEQEGAAYNTATRFDPRIAGRVPSTKDLID
jgi:hypothetical protein